MAAEFTVAVADADQYRIVVAGYPISQGAGQSGYADGEFFSCSQPTDSFVVKEGTDGTVVRSKTNTRLVEMSLSLLQTSSSNAFLSTLLSSDENTPGGVGIGSFVLQDLQGTTLLLCTRAWIRKRPDTALDRSAKERKWSFHGVWSVYIVGGN